MNEQAPLKRPECFELAMCLLGEPEATEVRAYVEALEGRVGGVAHGGLCRRLAVVEKRLAALESSRSQPAATRRVYINSPVQIAECGGPCADGGPEACDCGELWRDEPTTPQPQPEPPAVGVSARPDWRSSTLMETVEELADILEELRMEGSYLHCVQELLRHPRLGPLLRGEGQAKRVELPEEPPWDVLPALSTHYKHYERVAHDTWTAARAEVARQQGEGS